MIHLGELEDLAREKLDRTVFDYFAGGADDEETLARNRSAWRQLLLRYRVLAGVGQRDTSTTVLGQRVAFPALVAPMAFQKLAHDDGELGTVRSAAAAQTIAVLSMGASVQIEEAAAAAGGALWFQLYLTRDRNVTRDLVARVEAAGVRALVLTVDAPVFGKRRRDHRNAFELPPGTRVPAINNVTWAEFAQMLDPNVGWNDVVWLQSITKVPIVVKGVVRGDDARLAVEHGASGIVVSNHGGRQLDGSPATAEVLADVVAEAAGKAEVLVDGGIRSGADVVRALALGARAVLVGRPILWALAVDGQRGVARALALLAEEIDRAFALCGCKDVDAVTSDLLRRA
jgi:4-hydroxymandelate oxidase